MAVARVKRIEFPDTTAFVTVTAVPSAVTVYCELDGTDPAADVGFSPYISVSRVPAASTEAEVNTGATVSIVELFVTA